MTNERDTAIKAIIFDHDGTLVDSEGVHCACWNRVLQPYRQTLSYNDYCSDYNGLPTLETASRIRHKYGITTSAQTLYNSKISALNDHLASQPFPLLPGVIATLQYLELRNLPLAIASGANRKEVMHSVQAHQLESFFAAISTKDDVTHSKPAPDVYLQAAKQLGIEPQHCLAIEDSDTGEQSALAAGMPCIRLTPSPTPNTPWPQFKNMADVHLWMQQHLFT